MIISKFELRLINPATATLLSNETLLVTQENINQSRHMGNAWIFLSISHNVGKRNKTILWLKL